MVKLIVTHAGVAMLAVLGTANVLGTRHELAMTQAAAAVTGERLAEATDMQNRYNQFAQDLQRNAQTSEQLQAALRNLRAGIDSMRTDIAGRVATANREALAEYATTCNDVLRAMAKGGEQLSIIGAGIAAKADGHAADARLGLGR